MPKCVLVDDFSALVARTMIGDKGFGETADGLWQVSLSLTEKRQISQRQCFRGFVLELLAQVHRQLIVLPRLCKITEQAIHVTDEDACLGLTRLVSQLMKTFKSIGIIFESVLQIPQL